MEVCFFSSATNASKLREENQEEKPKKNWIPYPDCIKQHDDHKHNHNIIFKNALGTAGVEYNKDPHINGY